MPISFSAREIATTVCGGLFVWIAGNVAAANIKTFLSKRGYDAFLDRWAEHPILVRLCSRMIAGWQPMRKRWWLWLALGLSGGFSTALWVMPSAEIQSPPQESMQIPTPPATPPTPVHAVYNERDIRELLDSLDEASTLLEKHILPAAAATNGMTVNWFGAISNAGAKTYVENLRKMKAAQKNEIWDTINELVYATSNRHPDEMRMAFVLDNEAAKGELARSLQVAMDAVEKLPDNPSKSTRALIKPQFDEADRQAVIVWNWAMAARNGVASMKTNLKTRGITGFEK